MWELRNGRLLLPDGTLLPGRLQIEDKLISQIEPFYSQDAATPAANSIDVGGCIIAPGFIELQCNGGFGHDFTRDPGAIYEVASRLPRFGVTSFLPTIITSPAATIRQARAVIGSGTQSPSARPLGLHLEGPFINPAKKGAHRRAYCRQLTTAEVADWRPDTGIRLVTVAPELSGALRIIECLSDQGVVVSAGHTMATLAEAKAGFAAGIRYVTHLFNAMAPLRPREPGLIGAALAHEAVVIGLIADGIHLHPTVLKLMSEILGARLSIVSDSMAAMGAPAGRYTLGDQQVTVSQHDARLSDGTLAGSIITMDQALRNMQRWSDCNLVDLLYAVTACPARLLGLATKGHLIPQYDADLVVLTDNLEVVMTIVAGDICYDQRQEMIP